ncbi:MAG TPA: helix-turn-helix transcriptional regulator [Ignavibacteria bacterium]
MNQPELGKKIAELRKSKGLTQEDLVSKCNLTVRTLQRIESGVVTPRSYTIKMLFTALDYNLYNYSESDSKKRVSTFFQQKAEQLYKCVIDLFNLKTNTMKKVTILSIISIAIGFGLFTLIPSGNAQDIKKNDYSKFVESDGRGIIYMFPKGLKWSISNVKDTADYNIGKYLIQEYKNKIFLNKKFVGEVLEGDTVVLNKGKIAIRKSYWENESGTGNGIIYLFPKNMIVKNRSFYKDTVNWLLEDFHIKEFENKIFLNDKYIGTAHSGDTVIFKKGTLSIRNVR